MTASENDTLDFMKDNDELKYVTCATVRGYMNVNTSTVHKYNGRYGKDFVRTTPCYYRGNQSKSYMTIQYWVEK